MFNRPGRRESPTILSVLGETAGRTVVGCVATAAAQIANFWKYPRYGTGTHSYTWNGDQSCGGSTSSQTLSATYTDAYDWANMLNSYGGLYTTAQRDAVAELSYEMGVAFDMDYGYCSSGSWTDYGGICLSNLLQVRQCTREEKLVAIMPMPDAWFAELKKEFDNSLPQAPFSTGFTVTPSFCDGVIPGTTDYIHLNYGWAGSQNGWYAVDNLYCPWSGCNYLEEYAVTRIQPLNRLYTYVKGASNTMYVKYRTYYGYLQPSWETLPGGTSHAPAVAVFNNRQYMAIKRRIKQ